MKSVIKLILIVLVALAMTGCSTEYNNYGSWQEPQNVQETAASPSAQPTPAVSGTSSTKITIGISMQGLEAPYVARVKDYVEMTLEEIGPDVEAIILDGQENAEKQVSHVESFTSRKVDAIILNPVSFDGCAPAVDTAVKAGIPILTLITMVSNQDMCDSFVGSDHYESGVIEAEMMARELNWQGNIVILEGVMGIDSQLRRIEGYRRVLDKYPGIHVVAQQTASWRRSEAYAIVQNWIENDKDFDVVLSENDNMAMGAVMAIEEAKKADEIMVFGIDGDEDALQAVADGRLKGTVFQDAEAQARQAVYCAINLARRQAVNKQYVIPFKAVRMDNINDYL
jgi:inositol transport system substrate-binding protein